MTVHRQSHFIRAECLNSLEKGLGLAGPMPRFWSGASVEEKGVFMHLHLQPRQHTLSHTQIHTHAHTSSIKTLHSLLQLSIRKLSLGFRALAYRHLHTTVSPGAESMAPKSSPTENQVWLWAAGVVQVATGTLMSYNSQLGPRSLSLLQTHSSVGTPTRLFIP